MGVVTVLKLICWIGAATYAYNTSANLLRR